MYLIRKIDPNIPEELRYLNEGAGYGPIARAYVYSSPEDAIGECTPGVEEIVEVLPVVVRVLTVGPTE